MQKITAGAIGWYLVSVTAGSGYAQTSYSLRAALHTARENNPTLRAERYNVNIAESDIATAKLRPNPTLNNQTLQLVQPSHFPANTQWYNGSNRQVWWQLTKTFQWPGQRQRKMDFAEGSYRLEQKSYAETERNVFFDVAMQWLDVWLVGENLRVLESARNNMDSLEYINRIRFADSVITETDMLRTKLLADQYAMEMKTRRQEYVNQLKQLALVLGVTDSVVIDKSPDPDLGPKISKDSLVNLAVDNRTDLQLVQEAGNLAETNIRLQKSLAWPQPELGVIWNPQNRIQYVGIYATIDIPVFSRNQGEIKKSRYILGQAEQQLLSTRERVRVEVDAAYGSYQTRGREVENYRQVLERSDRILDNVRYAYLRGGTTIIDFLEAQRSWLDTRRQYNDALYAYRAAYIELLFVTGTINQWAQ